MDMLGPLLNRKSDLSVRNGVLPYKQLVRPMMDYSSPAWRSAARSHIRRLQVLQSKCLCLATVSSWYVNNRQIHEDLGVPLFADHIRALTESFDSNVSWCGEPHSTATRQILSWPRVDSVAWRKSQGRQGSTGQSRSLPVMAKSTKRSAFGAEQSSVLRLTWLRFFSDFSSVVRQMPGYTMQSWGTARTPLSQARRLHLCAWQKLHTYSLRQSQSRPRTHTANQPKFIPTILSPGQPMP